MKRYIITIGGTGSKCYEALVHLSAMGIFDYDVSVLHVDADKANGNWKVAFETLTHYQKIQKFNPESLFKVRFDVKSVSGAIGTFYPVPVKDSTVPTYYRSLNEYCPNQQLLQLLYPKNVIAESWEIGFKGRPSLGSVVVRGAFDWQREPWNSINQEIRQNINNDEVRVFLIGSIFGGTGAAIFPTIAKFFSDSFGSFDRFAISGALLFPYFEYVIPEGDEKEYARPENFLPKAKLHLEYYTSLGYMNPFKRIYILGEKYLKSVRAVTGGEAQKNPPHHLEPLAVMTAADFFKTQIGGFQGGAMEYRYLARANDDAVTWNDLPATTTAETTDATTTATPTAETTEDKWLVFTIMACSFVRFWYPLLGDDNFKRSRWFKHYLSDDVKFNDKLKTLKEYFVTYLKWLLGIHVVCSTRDDIVSNETPIDRKIQLFEATVLRDFLNSNSSEEGTGERLRRLKWGVYTPQVVYPYDYLWRKACGVITENKGNRIPFGSLVDTLYKISKEFKDQNFKK